MNERLDLVRHLKQLLLQGLAGGSGQQGRDDGDQERTAPDLARRLGGRGRLDDRESLRLECPRDLFALRADFIDDKDRRHLEPHDRTRSSASTLR